ncbi:Gfo/Idh/MocA family protein [Clostridium estertheticum]|uniref:Gfo/Idh/MocA family oxidoreductase n=1 Tax=Clostridium estertheticum TaxID=238834 RepID=A0AA47EKL9_9CLOT|nr:Gfo/Idh/MocA family oxidoreductase [Clostridium estertheticum]MBU3154606.1 Gfo/Idh/MocA family oxidoreductase [Clostridium estertheticum]WAG61964.1 Gfo/Idh/MocA family oxidoreductase [Clostridium estertheticum]
MDKKLKVGIIGCGGIANGKHMPSLAKISEIEMVAFCDVIIEKAKIAAKEYGSAGARVYVDYKELLKDDTIDVVHVCTPNRSHSVITIDVLEAGKHVMCEKPMAKTFLEARKMVEAAKRTGKKLTIGYQNRFRADSKYLKTTCENGGLGDIYFAKAHAIRRRAVPTWGVFLNEFEQGGGPLIDIGTHALDLTLWMLDNYKPKYVVGNVYHKLSKKENAANAWGPWEPSKFTVEDSAFGFITMDNGATIVVESSWALNSLEVGEAQTSLCGTEGGADMKDGLRINGENLGRLYETKVDFGSNGVAFNEGFSEDPADAEARSWIDCILYDKEPIVKPEQALVVTEILEAIYESSKIGEPVYFNDISEGKSPTSISGSYIP